MNAPEPSRALAVQQQPADQAVDLFTERGFALANRVAKAFATSDAVPAQFRAAVFKKERNGGQWIENPAAIGNCLVAIETARAVGMSITSVMQQANVIEGKLSWSAQFVIGAINASRRFTPLQFEFEQRGPVQAKYREKQGWNQAKGGFDFIERTVELEDVRCYAWAYAMDRGQVTQRKVVGPPVSMKMAVEEGWYGKSGSKWQGEMATLMLTYRAGSFFGRIHAPDIVMGMGQTSEERIDTIELAPEDVTIIHQTPPPVFGGEPPRKAAGATIVQRENEPEPPPFEPDPQTGEPPRKAVDQAVIDAIEEATPAARKDPPPETERAAPPAIAPDAAVELATVAEKQHIRGKVRDAGYDMQMTLNSFGAGKINPETLDGLTKAQFRAIKQGLGS